MKKLITLISVLAFTLLMMNLVNAQNLIAPQNQNLIQEREVERNRTQAQDLSQAQEMNNVRNRELEQERLQLEEQQRDIVQNQDRVRLGAYTIGTMLDLINANQNLEQNLNQIEQSIPVTIQAEEQIQQRSRIKTFFLGGDKDAAEKIKGQVEANRIRLEELNKIKNECNCDENLRLYLQEQIRLMEQEQNRLDQLAQNEQGKKSLWQWFVGLFS